MTASEKDSVKNISATEYILTSFQRSDHLAVLIRNSHRGETIQRITTVAKIAESSFQDWLRHKNEKESFDIYIGMNTLKLEARTRTKEDIETICHLYMDIDYDGPAALAKIQQSSLVPPRNYTLTPHRISFKWNGGSGTFHKNKRSPCSVPWCVSSAAIPQQPTYSIPRTLRASTGS